MNEQPPSARNSRRGLSGPVAILAAVGAALVAAIVVTRPLGTATPGPSFYVIGSAVPGPQVGQVAPDVTRAAGATEGGIVDLDGRPIGRSTLAGHPVWLLFWKANCQPCEAEAADVAAAVAGHPDAGLVVVGIDPWDATDTVRAWLADHPSGFPIALDPSRTALAAFGVWGAPSHYDIDADGIIRSRAFGPLTRTQMDAALATILAGR